MIIDGESLNLDSIYNVCFLGEKVEISKSALDKIRSGRESIQRIMDSGRSVYGVNTGYGSLLNVKISREDTEKLQLNLIRSHSAGSGRPLSREKVRAMMLVRANSLCRGYSGVSLDLVKKILEFLNLDICPFVPEYGSVGASGDLAPLAHLCLSLIGEGEIMVDGKRKDAGEILVSKGISPYRLKEKDIILSEGKDDLLRAGFDRDKMTFSKKRMILVASRNWFHSCRIRHKMRKGNCVGRH